MKILKLLPVLVMFASLQSFAQSTNIADAFHAYMNSYLDYKSDDVACILVNDPSHFQANIQTLKALIKSEGILTKGTETQKSAVVALEQSIQRAEKAYNDAVETRKFAIRMGTAVVGFVLVDGYLIKFGKGPSAPALPGYPAPTYDNFELIPYYASGIAKLGAGAAAGYLVGGKIIDHTASAQALSADVITDK